MRSKLHDAACVAIVRVLIPNPLRSYTADAGEVSARGRTLDELATDLDRQFPGLRFRIIDEQGSIRPHIKFFVNRQQKRGLAEALAESDEVMIVCALSGG
jgi:sulfur-carrier protein